MSKQPSKRQSALNSITYDFAKHGKDTGIAMNAYVENSVSYSAFQKAAKIGLQQFKTGKIF